MNKQTEPAKPDIAQWLRENAGPGPIGRRMVAAAKEIERLRAENAELTLIAYGERVDGK